MGYRVAIAIILLCLTSAADDIYVSTTGSDSGSGTIGSPYLTLGKAISTATGLPLATVKNIWMRGGVYTNVTASMSSFDSANVTIASYPGESAVLYGGIYLTNWSSAGSNGWYVATLPSFPTMQVSGVNQVTAWQPRTLIVGTNVIPRAREPASGKYFYTSFTSGGASLVYTNTFPASTNGEVQADASWEDSEMAIVAINTGTKTITTHDTFTQVQVGGARNAWDVQTFRLLNTPEGMSAATCFWWDKTNSTIVYKGADPSSSVCVVPVTTRMFKIEGTGTITNIVLSNLTVACTTCTIGTGDQDDGGNIYYPAVDINQSLNCAVVNCTLYGHAGHAIGNDNWAVNTNVTVRNCVIRDIGASAIRFPNSYYLTVSNNLLYNCGMLCQAGGGVAYSGYSLIQNNTVTNCSGVGIDAAIGSYRYSATIKDNWVENVCRELRDIGGIYVYAMSNTVFVHNFVGNVFSSFTNFYNWSAGDYAETNWNIHVALYSDQQSISTDFSSNIVYNCTMPFIIHRTTNALVLNNIFVNTRTTENNQLIFANSLNWKPRMTNNIYMCAAYPLINVCAYVPFGYDTNLAVTNWASNITWSSTGNNNFNPTNATTADPLFIKIPTAIPRYLDDANFGFQGGSPAPGLGMQPLSLAGIGYNGGLVNSPPQVQVVTLRVGNMRSAP